MMAPKQHVSDPTEGYREWLGRVQPRPLLRDFLIMAQSEKSCLYSIRSSANLIVSLRVL